MSIMLLVCFMNGRHKTDEGKCFMCGWLIENGKSTVAPNENARVFAERFGEWLNK